MPSNPLGFVGGVAKTGYGALEDTFSGETVGNYKPNKENFYFKGQGEGFYHDKAAQQGAITKANLANYDQSRAMQLQSRGQLDSQLQMLGKLATDPNMSQGATQLKAGQAANFQQSLALARSGGGAAQQAAALRGAMQQNTAANANTNLQAGIVRSQEAQAFAAQRGQLLMQTRAMDLQAAGLDAQTAMQQAQLELGSRQLNNQMQLGLYGLGQNAGALEQKGMMGYEGLKSGNYMASQIANAQIDAQRDASLAGMMGAIGGGIIAGGGAGSDIRGKTDIAPVAGTYAEGLNMPEQPSAVQVQNAQQHIASQPTFGQRFGNSMMQAGIAQMGAAASQPAGPSPYSFLQQPSMVDSDKRAKTAEAEVSALRSVVDRLTGGARAAGSVVAPGMVRAVAPAPQTMQTGAIQRPPDALDRQKAAVGGEAAAAAYGEQWVRANARAAQLEQIRQQDEADRIAAAQAGLARAQNQAGFIDATQASRQAEQEVSDERAKDVLAALRQRATEGEPGPETASFIQRARERMNEDQEKKLDHALLSAGLDRIAREATVDGGAPPLQAGRTNVARFDDVPATDMRQRHPLVAAATTTPISTWRYKEPFATETNIKNGLPPDAPQGYARRTGPMAQDLEQNPLYAPAVATGPDGMKRVDAGTTTMANTAVIADMARFAAEQEERIKRLEAGRSRVAYPKPKAAGL